jgi:uncharacterized membrane protein
MNQAIAQTCDEEANSMKVDETIEVAVPVQRAYNQWTQFETYPEFMEGIVQVEQLDDTRLHWVAEVAGKTKEWYANITRQVPDEVISWESEGGTETRGTVTFRPINNGITEIELHMEAKDDGFIEKLGSAVGVPDRQVGSDLKRFKEFIESRPSETGAWRGEVRHGAVDDDASQLRRKGYE